MSGKLRENSIKPNTGTLAKCPNCGSIGCEPVINVQKKGTNYSLTKGIIGSIAFGRAGSVYGYMGKGEQITTKTEWICQNCGERFEK